MRLGIFFVNIDAGVGWVTDEFVTVNYHGNTNLVNLCDRV
jgi:hypothetical protein